MQRGTNSPLYYNTKKKTMSDLIGSFRTVPNIDQSEMGMGGA